MKNSAATNLLILDEVFDSSLDASATGELLSILLKLGEGEGIDKFKRCLRFVDLKQQFIGSVSDAAIY